MYLITQSLPLALCETFTHSLIDFAKCEGKIGFHTDQMLHLLIKVGYVFILLP